MLKPFTGVLVSDFYSAYDSLPYPQQKCLVHFVRDIDDDLLKNPLDQELKSLAQDFGTLLKDIMLTVDRYGLTKYHLHKHAAIATRFLSITVRIPTKADTCSNSKRTLIPIDIGQLSERSDALGLVINKCPI
jgi:hypothetical protein